MKPKVIRTEADYEAALRRIEELMEGDPDPRSPEGEDLEIFGLLVERYEDEHYPMDFPDPLSAIRFRMDQQGLKSKDLVPFIGSAGKVSEVLSGRRNLSLRMIRNLVDGLGIPAESLIGKPCPGLKSDQAAPGWRKIPITEMLKPGGGRFAQPI